MFLKCKHPKLKSNLKAKPLPFEVRLAVWLQFRVLMAQIQLWLIISVSCVAHSKSPRDLRAFFFFFGLALVSHTGSCGPQRLHTVCAVLYAR